MRGALLALLLAWGITGTGYAQSEPLLQLQGAPFAGGDMTLHLSGDVGKQAFVLYGLNPLDPPLQLSKGAYFLGWLANIVPLGTIPSSGRVDMPFTLPPLHPSLAGIPLVIQGYVPGPLSNPATLPLDQPYYLPPNATILESPNPTNVGKFGDRVATGDLNGDGAEDIIVGAPKEHGGGVVEAGRVYVYWGPTLAVATALEAPSPRVKGFFGVGLAVADFDGDGVDDLLVTEGTGIPSVSPSGRGHCFHGGNPFIPPCQRA
jgi:hypothetical protein